MKPRPVLSPMSHKAFAAAKPTSPAGSSSAAFSTGKDWRDFISPNSAAAVARISESVSFCNAHSTSRTASGSRPMDPVAVTACRRVRGFVSRRPGFNTSQDVLSGCASKHAAGRINAIVSLVSRAILLDDDIDQFIRNDDDFQHLLAIQ